STTRPSLFVGDDDESDDDDDDACVEIQLVTPLRSAAMIPFLMKPGWELHSRGKGVMDNDAAPPSSGVS
ncbi:hypothetical protein Tco_0334469, partial [Tanacetum coccineum]